MLVFFKIDFVLLGFSCVRVCFGRFPVLCGVPNPEGDMENSPARSQACEFLKALRDVDPGFVQNLADDAELLLGIMGLAEDVCASKTSLERLCPTIFQ